MQDFREEFYKKYSSAFKEHLSDFGPKALKYVNDNYKYQFLNILNNYSKDSNILEIGCGRGIFLRFLKDNGFNNVLGIDISHEQVAIAENQGLVVKQCNVIDFLESNSKQFDMIFAIDFIEHLSKDELLPFFSSVYKTIKENGAFVFQTPNGMGINSDRIINGDLTHMTIFTPHSATQILRLVGFAKFNYFETEPFTKNFKGIIRVMIWNVIKIVRNFIRLIETGGTEKILTQNFVGHIIK